MNRGTKPRRGVCLLRTSGLSERVGERARKRISRKSGRAALGKNGGTGGVGREVAFGRKAAQAVRASERATPRPALGERKAGLGRGGEGGGGGGGSRPLAPFLKGRRLQTAPSPNLPAALCRLLQRRRWYLHGNHQDWGGDVFVREGEVSFPPPPPPLRSGEGIRRGLHSAHPLAEPFPPPPPPKRKGVPFLQPSQRKSPSSSTPSGLSLP